MSKYAAWPFLQSNILACVRVWSVEFLCWSF